MDLTGAFTVSGISSILLATIADKMVRLYPHPVANIVNCTFNLIKSEQLECRIIDNTGKLIKQFQWFVPNGSTTKFVDLSTIARGSYYLDLKELLLMNTLNL